MLIKDNEFGAPWNDQNYTVVFFLTVDFNGLEFKSKNLEESFTLSGPKHYDSHELNEEAYRIIKERYKSLFEYDNFIIHILGIS